MKRYRRSYRNRLITLAVIAAAVALRWITTL
jgi:hypothetical protein